MYAGDLIGVQKTCELLGISRPTLDSYRKKFEVSNIKIKKEIKFSKRNILTKLYAHLNPVSKKFSFNMYEGARIDCLKIDDTSYDLRKLDVLPDGHGAISLICHLISEINVGKNLHLLIDESNVFLKAMNFFGELKRYLNDQIFWDEYTFERIKKAEPFNSIKLPIRRLGVVGSQKTIVDDLTLSLTRQGYSEDICSYVGWAMGELADNSATHAKKHPSFVYFEQYGDDRKYLQFTIGDTGVGIPVSLKGNDRYKDLSNQQTILTSFKPDVSGRPDEEERGKGLTDVLKIAMECNSKLRVDSNGLGFAYLFGQGRDNFEQIVPIYRGEGTIVSIMFSDGNFGSVERKDVSKYIDSCLERL